MVSDGLAMLTLFDLNPDAFTGASTVLSDSPYFLARRQDPIPER